MLLPTNKQHVSFSEISEWKKCTWKHKLKYIEAINLSTRTEYLDFGVAIHAACENFLKTKKMDLSFATNIIHEAWKEHSFTDIEKWLLMAENILNDIPSFFEETFNNWEYISAEEKLYESIPDKSDVMFKGYIDGIIKYSDSKGKSKYCIVDYKTCSWGWPRHKKQSFDIAMQLIFYKNFWAAKHNISLKDIKCGFVLCKRAGKPGKMCEFVPISVGEVTTKRAFKIINNMITSLHRGIAIKNRESCKWCEYKDTEYCP